MSSSSKTESLDLSLEDIVVKANDVGLQYVAKKREADRLEILKPVVRAKIIEQIDDGNTTETKLKRICETHPEYISHLERIVDVRYEAERLKIRYDSYKNLFEAKRSLLSFKKVEMSIL